MSDDAAKTIRAGYLGQQSHAEFVREAYLEQGRKQERERIIAIIEKRKAYDCRCSCDCHAYEAPCNTCQADNELIQIIKGEVK